MYEHFLRELNEIAEINAELGLTRFSGMLEVYAETLSLFYKKLLSECEKMENFLREGDIRNFGINIHAMKSSLAIIGAAKLSDEAAALEEAAKKESFGDLVKCKQRFTVLSERLCALHSALSFVTALGVQAREREKGDAALLKRKINAALAAAEEYDADACSEEIRELLLYDYGELTDAILEDAANALREFDIESAVESLRQIKPV